MKANKAKQISFHNKKALFLHGEWRRNSLIMKQLLVQAKQTAHFSKKLQTRQKKDNTTLEQMGQILNQISSRHTTLQTNHTKNLSWNTV